MKKQVLFTALLAAGLMATSCSSTDDLPVASTGKDALSRFDAEGKAYVAVSINLPTQGSTTTRADAPTENYTPTAGSAEENDIKNAMLVLFSGQDNDPFNATNPAKVRSAYTINKKSANPATPANAEVENQWSVVPITSMGIESDENLFAYVILNAGGEFRVSDTNKLQKKTAGDTEAYEDMTGKTFAEFIKLEVPSSVIDPKSATKGIMMTNTPLSAKKGGTTEPKLSNSQEIIYMPQIDPENHFYTSIDDAEKATGDNLLQIYVERVAAKIGLGVSATALKESSDNKLKIKASFWQVDNLAKSFYTSRKVSKETLNVKWSESSRYRFISEAPVNNGKEYVGSNDTGASVGEGQTDTIDLKKLPKMYRINWAEDVDYTKSSTNNVVSTLAKSTAVPTAETYLASDSTAYVPENTVAADDMIQEKTTRVIVALQFNDGEDFYTWNIDGQDVIKKQDELETAIQKKLDDAGFTTVTSVKLTASAEAKPVLYGDEDKAKLGTVKITVEGTDKNAAEKYAHDNFSVRFYDKGWAYYKVQVRHFRRKSSDTDTMAEVKDPVLDNGASYDSVYPNNASGSKTEDYCGLYGVVRNTWYDIDINEVKHIGSPIVPEVPTNTPDDEVESYLSFKINVMSWAKRKHEIGL